MKNSVTKAVLAALAAGFTGITAAQAQVSCGAVITTKQVMTGNLFCVFNDPVVTIDGGELDMNGYTIGCLPGQDGVAMINSGGKLLNGSIEGCDRGAVLAGSGKHTVMNVSARNGSQTGFFILGSGNKLIQNTASGFTQEGFRAATAFPPLSDKFVDNIAANNGGDGFQISGDKSALTGNVAVGNGASGFVVTGEGNKITRNTAYDNGGFGLFIAGQRNSVTLNNAIGNQDTGLGALGAYGKVKSNLSVSNGDRGLIVNGVDGVFSRNTTILNGASGIDASSSGIQVTRSTAVLNDEHGIWIPSGSGGLVAGNRSTGNGITGLRVESTTTILKGNRAYANVSSDADDASATCATNTWISNVFGVKADACIQ